MKEKSQKELIITIDGPAGSGKTTTAKILAERLNFFLLESGKFYRFITYWLLTNFPKRAPNFFFQEKEENQKKLLEEIFKSLQIKCSITGTELWYQNRELKEELRSVEVEKFVSRIASQKIVREWVNNFLRFLAKGKKIVAEGRDMGSVVFPNADLKIFLTAKEEIRTQRRHLEQGLSKEKVQELLKKRDELDSKREIAPLQIPEGAYIIDNTDKSPTEVVNLIQKIIEEKIGKIGLTDEKW